jgi:putative ABC transport system substrate-binding protein
MNSVSIVGRFQKLCPDVQLELITQIASKTADIPQAAARLAGKVDAILISNDNTALSALASVTRAAGKVNIPVFVSDTDAVETGALAALGPSQYEVGKQTGRMIVRIAKGEKVSEQRVEFPEKTELYLNQAVADKLGITVPPALLVSAKQVIR